MYAPDLGWEGSTANTSAAPCSPSCQCPEYVIHQYSANTIVTLHIQGYNSCKPTIGNFFTITGRTLLVPPPGWKRLLAISYLRQYRSRHSAKTWLWKLRRWFVSSFTCNPPHSLHHYPTLFVAGGVVVVVAQQRPLHRVRLGLSHGDGRRVRHRRHRGRRQHQGRHVHAVTHQPAQIFLGKYKLFSFNYYYNHSSFSWCLITQEHCFWF